jgi:hypothetical protein
MLTYADITLSALVWAVCRIIDVLAYLRAVALAALRRRMLTYADVC